MAMTKETKSGWTVMAYMAGDNNLAEEMVLALQHFMYRPRPEPQGEAASRKPPNLLVQFDPTMLGLPTLRYACIDGMEGKKLHDFAADPPDDENDLNETNTGHPGALSGFIQWAIADPKKQRNTEALGVCKANHYALILSGHGSGATGDRFLADEYPQDAMSIRELNDALANGRRLVKVTKDRSLSARFLKSELAKAKAEGYSYLRHQFKFDILGLDACFMSMVEVAYEIRRHVKYVVGAEGFEPELGWPYDRILSRVEAIGIESQEEVAPEVLAKTIVEEYVDHYSDFEMTAGRAVDLAAIDADKLDDLRGPITTLSNCLRAALKILPLKDAIVLSHWEAQSYKFQQYVDLVDFCDCLRHRLRGKDLENEVKIEETKGQEVMSLKNLEQLDPGQLKRRTAATCDEVIKGVADCVLLSMCSGWQYQYSYGLSIYFPWFKVAEAYKDLEFAKDTKWDKFLNAYVEATCREPRRKGFLSYTTELKRQVLLRKAAVKFLKSHPDSRHGPRVERHGPRVERFGVNAEGSMKNFPKCYGRAKWSPDSNRSTDTQPNKDEKSQ